MTRDNQTDMLPERIAGLTAQIAARYVTALGALDPNGNYKRAVAADLIEARRRGYRVDLTRLLDATDRVMMHDVAQAVQCAADRPCQRPYCLQRRGHRPRKVACETESLFA